MTALFLRLVNMSITAGWLVLALLAVRAVFKRMPKAVACALWGLAALRLVLPFSLQSVLSMIPSRATIPETVLSDPVPRIESGVPFVNRTVNDFFVARAAAPAMPAVAAAAPGLTLTRVLSWVWLAGVCGLLLYALVSTALLRRRVRASIRLQDNVFLCDEVKSPFVFGLLRPRIFLPSSLPQAQMPLVLAHEQAHLARRDHLWKPFGFLLLSVYWFHPLLWVAYLLFCRDLELACDARVAARMPHLDRAAYSQALLDCGSGRHLYLTMPLAFGEVGIKQRVKAVLSYKKPTFWVLIGAVVVSSVLAVCFLTDPKDGPAPDTNGRVTVLESTGNNSQVRLDVKSLAFGPNGLTLAADWVNNGDDPIVFGEAFLVSRQNSAGHAVTCEAKQELIWTAIAYAVAPGGRMEKTYPLSLYDCESIGTYWFTMDYQFENGKGERWGQGQVTVRFRVENRASNDPRITVLKIGGSRKDVYWGVEELALDERGVALQVELHNESDAAAALTDFPALFRLKKSGRVDTQLTPKGGVEPAETGPVLPGKGKGVFGGTFDLSEYYDCTAPGSYRCALNYRLVDADGNTLSNDGQVFVDFKISEDGVSNAAIRLLETSAETDDVRIEVKSLQFADSVTAPLTAELEWHNDSDRAIVVNAMPYLWVGRGDAQKPLAFNAAAAVGTDALTVQAHGKRVQTIALSTFYPCTAPGVYLCRVPFQYLDKMMLSYRPSVSFSFEIAGAAQPGAYAVGTGSDRTDVFLMPGELLFDGKDLLTGAIFVNDGNRDIQAREEQWILRKENGRLLPVAALRPAEDRLLILDLSKGTNKACTYGASGAFSCTAPGEYRFQVHYRFADEPENSFSHVMWYDFYIPQTGQQEEPAEAPVQELDSSCGLPGVRLRLSDYELTADRLMLHLVCLNETGEDVMLRGDVVTSVNIGGYILGRVTATDAHWHRLGGLGTETFTVFVDANEYSAIVPEGLTCLTGETFDYGPLLQSGVWNLALSCKEPGKGKPYEQAQLRLLVQLPQPEQAPFSAMEPGDCGSEKPGLAAEAPIISVGDGNVFFSMELQNHTQEPVTILNGLQLFDNKTDRRIPLSTDHESRMNRSWTIEPDCGSGAGDRIPVKDLTALPAGTYRVEQEAQSADGSRFRVWMVFTLLPETLRLQSRNAAYMTAAREAVLTKELLRRAGYAGLQTAVQTAVFACYGKNDTKDGSVTYYLSALTRHKDGDSVAESTDVVAVTLRRSAADLYYSVTDYKVLGKGHETDGSVVPAEVYRAIAKDNKTPALLQLACSELLNRETRGFNADETPQPQIHPSVYQTYDASGGLTVYVWKMSEQNTRYGLLPGLPYRHTFSEKMALTGVSRDQMAEILNGYKTDKAKIHVRIFQQPYSSYLWDYDEKQLADQRMALGLDG